MNPPLASPPPQGGYCPHCGDPNAASALNCSGCGARLPWAATPAPRGAAPPVSRSPGSQPPAASSPRAPFSKAAAEFVSSDTGAETMRRVQVVRGWWDLLKFIPFFLLLAGVFVCAALYSTLPWPIALTVVGVMALVLLLQAITIRRMTAVRLDARARPAQPAGGPNVLAPDESVKLSIAGILWSGWRAEALGAGTVRNPHNALILTDRHILLVVVPMPGAGRLVGGTDYGLAQWMLARDVLRSQLGAMLSTMPLEQILRSDAANLALPLASTRVLPPGKVLGIAPSATFTFIARGGRRYRYALRSAQDIQALRTALGV